MWCLVRHHQPSSTNVISCLVCKFFASVLLMWAYGLEFEIRNFICNTVYNSFCSMLLDFSERIQGKKTPSNLLDHEMLEMTTTRSMCELHPEMIDYETTSDILPSVTTLSFLSGAKHLARGNELGIPKIKKPVAPRIPSQSVEAASAITDVKLRKKNDSSLDIPASSGTCQVL
ncbi:hypothetical protein Tco_0698093 [Tanacetum coccineum]